ncbi:hypothetical protein HWV62_19131 [Athelia sp. TMB]|nr:hypothetical protein HWV62_19131 [Athelia sp. TMB]
MTRRKNGDPTVKRGKKSWVSGTKARFLQTHNEAWFESTARGSDAAGAFYSQVTKLWIKKYGWHFDCEKDLDEDTPDPTLEDLLEPEEPVDDEEAQKRAEYYQIMRPKIRNYFYRLNNTVSSADAAKEIVEILESAAEGNSKPPRKPQLLHYYSNLYYPSRIKPTVDDEWAKMKASDTDVEKKVRFVDFQNKITRRFWKNETQAFRDNLQAKLESEHSAKRKAFEEHIARVAKENPESPEAYHSRLSTAGATLNNLCAALGKQYGMNVSILLCGPIGARDGRIELRSVHSGVTRGFDSKKWPQACPEEFREVQESMVAFTKRCYTAQQCAERSLGASSQGVDADEAVALATGPEGFGLYTLDEDSTASTKSSTPSCTSPLNRSASIADDGVALGAAAVPHKAPAADFDPLDLDSYVDLEPPEGLDHISTDFFGNPENLTLLTQQMREEEEGQGGEEDEVRAMRVEHRQWDTFKALLEKDIPSLSNTTGLDEQAAAVDLNPLATADPYSVLSQTGMGGKSSAPHTEHPADTDTMRGSISATLNAPPPAPPSIADVEGAHAFGLTGQGDALAGGSAADTDAPLYNADANGHARTSPQPVTPMDSCDADGRPRSSPQPRVTSPVLRTPSLTPSLPRMPSPSLPDAAVAPVPTQAAISVEFHDCPAASRALYAPLFDAAHQLSPDFRACVGSLLKLERAAGWTLKDHRLPTAGRPSEYAEWMRRARQPDFNRFEPDFGERLWLWWTSMQPPARVDDARLMRTSTQGLNWGAAAAPGKSGLFLIVLGLYWWAKSDGEHIEDLWREAVVDVTWVCEHIVKFGGLPATASSKSAASQNAKRKRPEDPVAEPLTRRRKAVSSRQ